MCLRSPKTYDFKGFRLDVNRILKSGKKLLDLLLGRPHLRGAEQTVVSKPWFGTLGEAKVKST